jgi:uncharacterized membrane protein
MIHTVVNESFVCFFGICVHFICGCITKSMGRILYFGHSIITKSRQSQKDRHKMAKKKYAKRQTMIYKTLHSN